MLLHTVLLWEASWSVIQRAEGESCLSLLVYREVLLRLLRKEVPIT